METKMRKSPCDSCIHANVCAWVPVYSKTGCNDYAPGWISVDVRLPDRDGSYIVCTERGAVLITHFYPGIKSFGLKNANLVTHWMERPVPPKEATNG